MNNPHGGKLINRNVKKSSLDFDNIDLEYSLDTNQIKELWNIAKGVYSPLIGYMSEEDVISVMDKMRLASGEVWTIPVFLPVNNSEYSKVKIGSQVMLKDSEGKELALLVVSSKYKIPKKKMSESVWGTSSRKHPGVKMLYDWEDYALGGEVFVFGKINPAFKQFAKTPKQTRKDFEKNGWKTIVGFQTRNPIHRAHEFIQKECLEFVDAIFVNPIVGGKKSGDFKDEVILEVYEKVLSEFYPPNSSYMAIYQSRMNYAGPREAVMHAIVRKNFGCTHFIVGRDHAGVGDYYGMFDSQEIFEKFPDLEIEIFKVSDAFFCRRCDIYTTGKVCPHNRIYHVAPSGTQIREYIKNEKIESLRQVMRDEVLDIIFANEKPFVE